MPFDGDLPALEVGLSVFFPNGPVALRAWGTPEERAAKIRDIQRQPARLDAAPARSAAG